ncbi:hypothetical protein BH11BAC7_BH11BAC7_19400 [soil metagenome]
MKFLPAVLLVFLSVHLDAKRVPNTRNFDFCEYVYNNLSLEDSPWFEPYVSQATAKKNALKSLHAETGKRTVDMYYDSAGKFVRRCYWTYGMVQGDLYELKLTYDSILDKKGISRIKTHVFGKFSWRDSIVLTYDENGYPLRKKKFRVTGYGVDVNADYHFAYTNSRKFNHVRVFTVYLNDTTNCWELKYNKYTGELWYKVYYRSA